MNIFALERKSDGSIDWEASANSHDTYRTNKMYLESTQMVFKHVTEMLISTTHQLYGLENHLLIIATC